jgi:hypothetical protein
MDEKALKYSGDNANNYKNSKIITVDPDVKDSDQFFMI